MDIEGYRALEEQGQTRAQGGHCARAGPPPTVFRRREATSYVALHWPRLASLDHRTAERRRGLVCVQQCAGQPPLLGARRRPPRKRLRRLVAVQALVGRQPVPQRGDHDQAAEPDRRDVVRRTRVARLRGASPPPSLLVHGDPHKLAAAKREEHAREGAVALPVIAGTNASVDEPAVGLAPVERRRARQARTQDAPQALARRPEQRARYRPTRSVRRVSDEPGLSWAGKERRDSFFTSAHADSIGFMSGEYGGRNLSSAPTDAIISRTSEPLWT